MKIKTSDLIGTALDWAVAVALGYKPRIYGLRSIRAQTPTGGVLAPFMPSFRWAHGGPIMERELIAPAPELDDNCDLIQWTCRNWKGDGSDFYGFTKLTAAMRCCVASKSGNEVEVPDELL